VLLRAVAACALVLVWICAGLTRCIQLEKTQSGEGVALIHPKGKEKACGTIFIRLKAIPRLSEDEIAANMQVFCVHACDSIYSICAYIEYNFAPACPGCT
jgi:hypothetical protein